MNNNLDIFLITYNRRDYLEITLNKVLGEDSPLKKYQITILDNNSNDGTEELCRSFESKFSNLKYIKNKRNVGLSGNICKAMEYAEKKYFWIMCDNDELDFSAWDEVEKSMEEDKDLILVCRDYYEGKDDKKHYDAFVLNQLTFLPSGIYKTEHLTDSVMSYAISDTYTVLPHLPLGCAILNKKGSVVLISHSVVTLTGNVKIESLKTYDFDRIKKDPYIKKNERIKSINFPAGIVDSFDACEDKKVRGIAISNFARKINGMYGPFISPSVMLMSKAPNYIKKEYEAKLPLGLKFRYNLYKLAMPILCLVRFYYSDISLYVCLCNKLKIRIWSKKWFVWSCIIMH